jgi:dihydrofolate reductase
MRRLVLQMQTTVDGFMEAADGQRWQVWDWGPHCTWDQRLQHYFNQVYSEADTILLSHDMAVGGFIDHWHRIGEERSGDPAFDFARRVGRIEKVIATRQPLSPGWQRSRVLSGRLQQAITGLKAEPGETILAFGGIRFAAKLLAGGLVDELQLFVNPTVVGDGRSIFGGGGQRFRLQGSQAYECGIVVNRYALA